MNFNEDDRDTSDEEDDLEETFSPESSRPTPSTSRVTTINPDTPDDSAFVEFERLKPPRRLSKQEKRAREPTTRAHATPEEKEKAKIRFKTPLRKDVDRPSPQKLLLTITSAESSKASAEPMSKANAWQGLGSRALRLQQAKMQLLRSMQEELSELRNRTKQLRHLPNIARRTRQFSAHVGFEKEI